MEKNLVQEIFVTLKQAGLASNEGEFSEFWLGHGESYLRSLRFKKIEASLGALAICASRLQNAGEAMIDSSQHKGLGWMCLSLSARCHREINKNGPEIVLCGEYR